MKVITITSRKGGTGKTTTAAALAAYLSRQGRRVLMIDLDSQKNLTFITGSDETGGSAASVMFGNATISETAKETPYGAILAGSARLAEADSILTKTGREYRLKEALEGVTDLYDYCIIDTPAQLGILTINALTASTSAIITAQADILSLQGIGQLKDILETTRKYCNPSLAVSGLLLTRYNNRTVLSRTIRDSMAEMAGMLHTSVFNIVIRECTAIKEAQAVQKDIFTYAPRSNAAKDYTAFCLEFMQREKARP